MRLDAEEEVRAAWSSGSYSEMDQNYLGMAARLVEDAGVGANDDVLDVGCGTGNVAITAARRGADASGLDLTPTMLERARENAEIAGVDGIEWHEGNATDLPFGDDTFDVTLSALGHMYGDPPDAAARELLRVTRPGGRIGFTSWTPASLFPAMAGHVVAHLPSEAHPEFTEPPFLWGDRDTVEERLGPAADDLDFEVGTVTYPALSPSHFWEEMVSHSGLFVTFLEAVDDRSALREDVVEAIESYFEDDENAVGLEYLRTTATVRESDRP